MSVLSRLRVVARPLSNCSNSTFVRRAYGSAAAVDVQYDDYYEDDDEFERMNGYPNEAQLMVDSYGCVPVRGVQWVVLGDPGAKKHVYAERLSKLLGVPHISMGSLVRQELNPRSSIYQKIASAVNEGKPAPEEIIFGLLSKRLEEGYCNGETGFILDGVPRTKNQAEILDKIADIDLVINFKAGEETFVTKNLGSRNLSSFHEYNKTMSGSGSNLNLQHQDKDPKSFSTTSECSWKEKVIVEQSKALEDYYRRQRKLVDFKVTGGPGETWQGLLEALHLQHHVHAVNSTQKLTA